MNESKKQISVTQALNDGWNIMWKNVISLFLLSLAFTLTLLLISYFLGLLSLQFSPAFFDVFGILNHLILMIVPTIAVANISLKLADNQKITFADLFSRLKLSPQILIAQVLMILAILCGLVLLVVPGIVFAIRFSLYDLLIVDKNYGPIVALEKSWELLKGYSWKWLGFEILCLLINILGLLCFIIGFFFTYPATIVARALLYKRLSLAPVIVE